MSHRWYFLAFPKQKASPGSYLKQLLSILRSVLNEHSKINQDKGKKNKKLRLFLPRGKRMWHELIETLIQMAHVYGWKGVMVWDQNFLLATKWKSLIMQIFEETGLFYTLWDHSCCLIITKIKLTLSQRKIRNTEGPWSKYSVWFHEESCFYSNSSKHTRGIIYCFFLQRED